MKLVKLTREVVVTPILGGITKSLIPCNLFWLYRNLLKYLRIKKNSSAQYILIATAHSFHLKLLFKLIEIGLWVTFTHSLSNSAEVTGSINLGITAHQDLKDSIMDEDILFLC